MHARSLIAVLPALFLLTPVSGQAPAPKPEEQTIILNPFVVSADQDRGYISTNAISATRIDTPIKDIPVQVTVLNQAYIDDVNAVTLQEAMQFSAGFDSEAGNRIRGMESMFDGNANRNGVGVNSRGATNRGEPTVTADRIEIFKGPSSIINGAALPGGSLNVVTKRPRDRTGGLVEVGAGSWGLQRAKAEYNQAVSRRFAVLALASYIERDTDQWDRRDWHDESTTLFASLRFRPSRRDTIYFDVEQTDTDDMPLSGDAFASFSTGLAGAQVPFHRQFGMPLDFHYAGPDRVRINERLLAGVTWTREWIPGLSTNLQFSHQKRDEQNFEAVSELLNTNSATPVDPLLGRRPYEIRRRWQDTYRNDRFYQTNFVALYKFEAARLKNTVYAEYMMKPYYYDFNRYSHRAAGSRVNDAYEWFPLEALQGNASRFYALNLAQPTAFNWVFNPINNASNSTKVEDWSFSTRYLGQFDSRAGRFYLLAGANKAHQERWQYDHVRAPGSPTSGEAQQWIGQTNYSSRDSDWLYSVGAVYQPSETLSFYVNANKSYTFQFRRNSFSELLPNTGGKNLELGAKIELLGGKLVGQLSWFDALFYDRPLSLSGQPVRDSILQDGTVVATPQDAAKWDPVRNPIVSGAGTEWFATGEFGSTGTDVELILTPMANWQTTFSYLHVDAKVENDVNPVQIGRRESGNAKDTLALFTNYSLPSGLLKGFTLGGGYRWSSERVDTYLVLNGVNTLISKDGYDSLTFFARHRWKMAGRTWTAQFNVNNLLKEDALFGIVPGTQATANQLRFRFERPIDWRIQLGVAF